MDKLDRALAGVEQNAEYIRGAEKSLRALVRSRTAVVSLDGSAANGATGFGEISADGMAVVVFDGAPCSLVFCGEAVATGGSPLVAALSGRGELELSAERQNARAVVTGAQRI